MTNKVLIVPGRQNGPVHWQTLWQLKHPEYVRVQHEDLDQAIRNAEGRVFIVAHDTGCIAAVRRLSQRSADVAGALLVAPADTALLSVDELPTPSILVASRNDPGMRFDNARLLARRLGSRFISEGAAGRIDGPWPEGERLLEKLIARSLAGERALLVSLALST
jgi:predicted alpha/beta hydrolase family esterase